MYVCKVLGLFREKVTSTCLTASAPKWRIPCRLLQKLGAMVIFNRISRVDVNISLEEQFRSNIEDRGNDVKLVKVKVGEERGGSWSDIDESETVQSCKDMQLRCILFVCASAEPEEVLLKLKYFTIETEIFQNKKNFVSKI